QAVCPVLPCHISSPVTWFYFFFFFQAEDGIRDPLVTGVQTCALPISRRRAGHEILHPVGTTACRRDVDLFRADHHDGRRHAEDRSEERRVGKECRSAR